jgi:hypothetical protein
MVSTASVIPVRTYSKLAGRDVIGSLSLMYPYTLQSSEVLKQAIVVAKLSVNHVQSMMICTISKRL